MAHADTSAARAALRALAYDLEGVAAQTMNTGMRLAQALARNTTAWKDGTSSTGLRTRDTIRGYASGTKGVFEAQGASLFLENGTRAHMIWAKRALAGSVSRGTANESPSGGGARVLAFMQNGSMRFAKMVFHPGTKATHFMKDAAAEAMLWMVDTLQHDSAARITRRGFG